jgi:hypothetical protein
VFFKKSDHLGFVGADPQLIMSFVLELFHLLSERSVPRRAADVFAIFLLAKPYSRCHHK